jgi:hypothetical protein
MPAACGLLVERPNGSRFWLCSDGSKINEGLAKIIKDMHAIAKAVGNIPSNGT